MELQKLIEEQLATAYRSNCCLAAFKFFALFYSLYYMSMEKGAKCHLCTEYIDFGFPLPIFNHSALLCDACIFAF